MSTSSRHALVLGAGIFGATAALELAERGWSVELVDRFGGRTPAPHPRASSTDVSKVIRMDYGADRWFTELAGEAMRGWSDWNARFHRRLFHRTGFLLLSREPMDEPGASPSFEAASFALLQELGEPVRRMDPETLRHQHPAWNADRYPDGYLNPRAGWAESGAVVGEVLAWARSAGVRLVDAEATSIEPEGEGARVGLRTRAGSREVRADAVVVATGAWTSRLLPGVATSIEARAMPVVHVRPTEPDLFSADLFPVWGADIARTGWYGFPLHRDGFVKVGHHGRGWADDPETADGLPDGFEDRLRDFLADSLPALADGEIVHRRVCFYADAVDGAFWIDRIPGSPGVVIASGGSGHGFKFGPVLGGLVADAVEGVREARRSRLLWRPGAGRAREDARSDVEVQSTDGGSGVA